MEDLRDSDPHEIGPYRLLGRIGSGGMGVVYLATDASGHRTALKLIRSDLADDPGFRERFRREVQAGQRVGGICTARYIDADLDSDHPYLVTEYVAEGNLHEYVTRHGPLKGDQLVGLAVGLAEALVAMEAVGVVHRDLKPSNVLMASSGPKVVDFGVSQALDGTALTQTGHILGSPGWMAPEQAQGRAATAAADVFAWGATIAFAGTGHSPFGEGLPDAILYRVVHEDPDLDGLDPRLLSSVQQTLQKNPAQRPTADQLLVELVRTAMAGGTPTGGSVSMATAVLDRTWHHPEPPAAVPEIADDPSSQHGRNNTLLGVAAFVAIALAIGLSVLLLGHSHQNALSTSSTTTTHHQTAASVPRSTSTTTQASTTTTVGSTSVSAVLPLVVCPTSQGVSPTSTVPLPSTISASVPSNLSSQLAMYSDVEGYLKVLGPTGWSCSADIGADGSTRVLIYPSGESPPSSEPFQSSSAEAVMASSTGGCSGCAITQAAPLFPTAASQCAGFQCQTQPAGESTEPIASGVVGFLDPPGVAGDGDPSGGSYPANGVMTFTSMGYTQSYLDTCTLPQSQHALCTAVLDNFALQYGSSQ